MLLSRRKTLRAVVGFAALSGACGGSSSGGPSSDANVGDAGGPTDARPARGKDASPHHGDGGGAAHDGAAAHDATGAHDAKMPAVDGGKPTGLHVVMGDNGMPGHIVDGAGNVVQLHGVDRSGTEYACIQGWGFFDGPSDQTSIDAIKSWNANAVRVPLNEDCWLNINGVKAMYGGQNYVSAVTDYVNLLTTSGLVVILDLHWAAPGSEAATGQLGMADADHAPTFWSQVAAAFASNGSVIFDLFNEPFITDWGCWTSGGSCAVDSSNVSYTAAGMATLIQAVRGAGANNVVILGGLAYSSDFSKWVSSVQSMTSLPAPLDGISIANVAASWHVYDFNSEQTGCPSQYNGYATSQTCYSAEMTATNTGVTTVLAAGFPLVTGESGISAYQTMTPFSTAQVGQLETWYDNQLTWIAQQGQSYLAWDWNVSGSPYLLLDYTGTPTPGFGVTYQAHIKGL
jgi:endoglucanase